MSGPGSAPASRTADGPLIPLFTWSGWLSRVRAGPPGRCVGSRAPARLAPPGPRLGTRGQWFSGSNTFGLLSGRCAPPRVERRKSKSWQWTLWPARCSGAGACHVARRSCPTVWASHTSELSASGLLPSPAGPGRQGRAVSCALGRVQASRGGPRGPSGAHAPCQGSKGRTRGAFPFLLVWETHLPGPAEDFGLRGCVSLGCPPEHLHVACSRVTCRWLKQQPVTAEQRQNLWLRQPCPGPEASIILDHRQARGKHHEGLLAETLQGAPRSQLTPKGPPGEGRRSPRERTRRGGGSLPPTASVLRASLSAAPEADPPRGIRPFPCCQLSYFLSCPRLFDGGNQAVCR